MKELGVVWNEESKTRQIGRIIFSSILTLDMVRSEGRNEIITVIVSFMSPDAYSLLIKSSLLGSGFEVFREELLFFIELILRTLPSKSFS